jgi:hypothetical protein
MNRLAHKRAGFTLIELTVTMGAGGTLMFLAIGLVHQTMSLSSIGRERCDHQRTTTRLASQFRRDVHRAQQYSVESPSSVQLVLPGDGVVSYQAEDNHLIRLQPLDDGTTRREVFRLEERSSVTLESLQDPTRAVLTIMHHPPATAAQPRLDRRVEALLGRLTAHQQGEPSP